MPAFFVGIFDAPLLMALATKAASLIHSNDLLMHYYPQDMIVTSLPELIGAAVICLYVFSFEFLYYRYVDNGERIVRRFRRFSADAISKANHLGLFYAFTAIVSGVVIYVAVN